MEPSSTPDAVSIARALLDRTEAAIATRDLAALDALCLEETVLFGTSAANFGAAATRAYLRLVADGHRVRWLLDRWEVLHEEPERLLVAGTGELEVDDGSGPDRSDFRLTMWLVVADGEWRMAHFHGSVPVA